jgi:hypothetical protein
MGFLGRLDRALAAGLVVLAGCYSPEIRDCTVSCASPHDCVRGQICGRDGLCAAPEIAGRCPSALPDGGPSHDAGSSADATMTADAPATVSLHVQISGKGSVIVIGHGTCSSLDPQRGQCTYDIALGIPQTVLATDIQPSEAFSKWISATCDGQDARCTFTPAAATTVVAKFVKVGLIL